MRGQERKIRTSTEMRNTTPLVEKNKRLLRKIKDLEQSKKKLDERNKALSEENQKLVSVWDTAKKSRYVFPDVPRVLNVNVGHTYTCM